MQLAHISTAWYGATIVTIGFVVLVPLVLGFALHRRLRVGWRYFAFGALIFFLFQLITRVPAVEIIQAILTPQLKASPALRWAWYVILALTAGLFEEVGRFVGYRWLMGKENKTWNKAVMYGAGHGGLESMLLVGGLGLLTLIQLLIIPSLNLSSLPAATQKQIADQFAAIAAQPAWLPLLGGYERVCAIAFHIAMSVVVLQVFRRGQIRWLWVAVLSHFAFDFSAIAVAQVLPALGVSNATLVTLATEGVVAVGALLALWLIFALRDGSSAPAVDGSALAESSVAPANE